MHQKYKMDHSYSKRKKRFYIPNKFKNRFQNAWAKQQPDFKQSDRQKCGKFDEHIFKRT